MSPYQKHSKSYKLAGLILENPKKSFALGLALLLALIPGLAFMQADFGYRIWFRESDPLLARFDAFERQFGNDEMLAVIVHSPSGIFDEASVKLTQELTDDFWLVEEVIRVDSLANYNWTHSEEDDLMVEPLLDPELEWTPELLAQRKKVALAHEMIPGYLVSEDGEAAVFYLQLKPAIGGTPEFEKVVLSARATLAKYEGRGDHAFYLTGPAAISNTFKEVTQADMSVMVPILLGTIVLFLLFFFRRFSGIAIPFAVVFGSIFATLGFAGWIGIEFNNLTSIVPNILIAIGVADAVHILVTFFQFRGKGYYRYDAAHATLVKNLVPTLLTSISTGIGFFSFATGDIMPIVYMGILAGTGTLIAWVVTILMMGPILPHLPGKIKERDKKEASNDAHPLAISYAKWLAANSRPMIAFFSILLVVSIIVGSQNQVNSNPLKYFAPNVHTRIANDFAQDKVGGMQGLEMVIDSGRPDGIKNPDFLAKVDKFDSWLLGREHVTKTISILDIIKESNRALNNNDPEAYIVPDNQELIAQELFLYTMSLPQGMDLNNRMTLDNQRMRLTAMSDENQSRIMLKEMAVIEAKAAELGLAVEITGKMPLYHNMNPYVVNGFAKSISMALVLVSLLMFVALRDWRLGLLSMIPNTVPLIIGGAFMYMMGKPLDIGTVLVASTCLGIAVDDTIHFLANYKRWRGIGTDRVMAIAHVVTHTGPALFVTTTVLIAGFATFAFSSFVPNINFGILTAIVLGTALVTDFTLLPAILLSRTQPQEAVETVLQPLGAEG